MPLPGADCEQLLCGACLQIAHSTLTQRTNFSQVRLDSSGQRGSGVLTSRSDLEQEELFLEAVCQEASLKVRFIDLLGEVCIRLAKSKVRTSPTAVSGLIRSRLAIAGFAVVFVCPSYYFLQCDQA